MPMLRNFVTPLLRETVRSMLLETGPSAITVSFAEGDDATTALFTADPAAGTLALVNALDAADFALDASTGALTWAITPDYETQISHSVDISTTDGNGDVTLQRVTVRITPVSEFAPSFGATPTTASVAENVSAATFFTPSVTDADAGETITFALSGTHAALFTMDTTSGALRFTSAADFENGQGAGTGGNVYDVTITASDGTQSTAHGLQVTVTDVADEAPVFTSATSASTPENNTGVFYTAAATGDAGSAVTFAIQGGYSYAAAFSVNSTSGAVSFEAPGADFEVLASYTLPIVATDAAGNAATLSLAITVTDVDEIAPVFTSAAAVSVVENILGTVYTAVATDASAVTYSLAAGVQDNDLFAIDGASGAVTFNSSPDFETPADADADNVYDLTITATDGSANASTLSVAITVTDVASETSVPTAYLDLDFSSNSYRLDDTASSFDAAFVGSSPKLTYGTTSNSTMTNSSGTIVWAPHNLVEDSEDFSQWSAGAVGSLSVGGQAPDGTASATTVQASGVGGSGNTALNVSATLKANATYTFSVYAKSGTLDFISLSNLSYTTGTGTSWFDLATPEVAFENANHTAIIEDVGNQWYRCSITFATTTDTTGNVWLTINDSASFSTPQNGASVAHIWGAHLYRSDLGGMAPVPGAATGLETYVPTNGAAEYLPRVGHHVYNGSTWVNEGLLLESEDRTNLAASSNVFTTAGASTVTANSGVSPTGETNAVLAETGSSSTSAAIFLPAFSAPAINTSITISCYVKDVAGSGILAFFFRSNAGINQTKVWFNLNTGTKGTQGANVGSTSVSDFDIADVGGGWYRLYVVGKDTNQTSFNPLIFSAAADNSSTRDANGEVLLFGAHVYRSGLGGMAPVPGAATGLETYVPTNGAVEYLPRVGHHIYNGSTWVNEGLLLESEARTNLVTHSKEFENSAWLKTNASISGTLTSSPDGQTEGRTVTFSGTNDLLRFIGPSWTQGETYTASVWLRSGSVGGVSSVRFSLLVSDTSGSMLLTVNTDVTVTSDWQRVHVSGTAPAGTPGSVRMRLTSLEAGTLDVFGAQLEVGDTPSSYIPTSGSTVTRGGQTLDVPSAELGWNSAGVSFAMEGRMTYADNSLNAVLPTNQEVQFYRQYINGSNDWIFASLKTTTSRTGQPVVAHRDSVGGRHISNGVGTQYSPGVLVPYSVAARHSATVAQGAAEGTAFVAASTSGVLPDLSATPIEFGFDFMGTISHFRQWDEDIGETGIEEASS